MSISKVKDKNVHLQQQDGAAKEKEEGIWAEIKEGNEKTREKIIKEIGKVRMNNVENSIMTVNVPRRQLHLMDDGLCKSKAWRKTDSATNGIKTSFHWFLIDWLGGSQIFQFLIWIAVVICEEGELFRGRTND